jgi:hypothetical protein
MRKLRPLMLDPHWIRIGILVDRFLEEGQSAPPLHRPTDPLRRHVRDHRRFGVAATPLTGGTSAPAIVTLATFLSLANNESRSSL